MQYGKVEICGINTSELKVLGEKEKMDLLRKAQAGDKQARDALICGNLRLVLSVIQRFSGRGESMDDLFQVGVIGLIKAIDHFNTELNVKFSTYAVPMCVGEVRRFLRDDNPVRVSRSMRDTAYKAMQVKEQLMAANGREPTVDEMMIKDQIRRLDDRERNILYKRFMEGKTQMEVASEIGISQAQVSRLEKTALRRIKGK